MRDRDPYAVSTLNPFPIRVTIRSSLGFAQQETLGLLMRHRARTAGSLPFLELRIHRLRFGLLKIVG